MFTKADFETDSNFTKEILDKILVKVNHGCLFTLKELPTFRACYKHNTTEKEIDELVDELNDEVWAMLENKTH